MLSFLQFRPIPNSKKLGPLSVFFIITLNYCITHEALAQQKNAPVATISFIKDTKKSTGITGAESGFIKNIGQYGKTMTGYETMGAIQFGYEGLSMPVLFTEKGLIHLHRKLKEISHEEKERMEKAGMKEEEIEGRMDITDQVIAMEWLGANPDPEIVADDKTTGYHTYGLLPDKAYGYKKLTYKNMYSGIDIVYSFINNGQPGFEYSIIVKPGADLNLVKLKYGGNIKSIKTNNKGNLIISSGIDGISSSTPVSYYGDWISNRNISDIKSVYAIKGNEISFSFPQEYDHTRSLVIDPFVTGTGNLTGLNAGKAKDVDFDYAGNIYVTGGGNSTTHQLAKYNAAGALQWTFNGSLTIPSWTFGSYWGGWMVEKPTGNIYLGQGFNPTTGFQVIRVSTTGLYDNYITNANPAFREAWKMYWSCNNGTPQILVAGGGTNSNINFGVFAPPSTAIGSLNVTGIPYTVSTGWAQDIVDFIIDPANNEMYTIYGSLYGTPSLTNKIYKNTAPYSGTSVAWNVPSGFTAVQEIANRPYLAGGQIDNSANIFAINSSYLYYWDGKNLKAIDKATGNGVGSPLLTSNTPLMQGGVIADACNNVFVGDGNGVIKVYKFNGSIFDDAGAPDISIPGFSGKAVYDLAYDESKKLLYASGDGFVASFDISSYCPTSQYTLNVVPSCLTASVTVTVSPTPPAGSTITFVLYNGATQIGTNTSGVFTGLTPNVTYNILATINLACSGTQAGASFVLPGPIVTLTQSNSICGSATGSITATASATTAPYTYNIDGGAFQSGGNFTGLAGSIHTIISKDALGCQTTSVVSLLNGNGPVLTFTQTNADCGNNDATVTASANAGSSPYQYSINGGATYQSSNFFTGLISGNYTLIVKDAGSCTNSAIVTITSSPSPLLTAIPATATCGKNNGSITAFGSSGTSPLQYSINGNTFQANNIFNNLTPGTYTVTVKDANGCLKTTGVTIANSPAPTVSASSSASACGNINGTITATGIGGLAPLQFSMDGINFQTGNIFTGLTAGNYTITVKDNSGCTNIATVIVANTGAPTVTATSTSSSCNTNNGSIIVTANGGLLPYQYSSNGATFQASNIISGLGAGNYVVYVKDAGGCIGTFPLAVASLSAPLLTLTTIASSCTASDGSITVTGSGGIAPYQYSLDGITFQPAPLFTGLAPNNYTVFIKDANGCSSTKAISVTNVAGLTLAVSTITSSCNIINGVITATASGGVAPLQYSINGTTFQPGNVFNGIAPGNYTVYVKDANGCIISKSVTIASPGGQALTVTSTDATCGGANGIIIATGSGGLAPLTYSIDAVNFQSSGTFINVVPGTYTVTVKDATGCRTSQSSVIISNIGTGAGISAFTVVTKGGYPCNGDQGKITNPRVNGANCNNCTFSLNFGAFVPNSTQLFLNLPAGTYTVTAQDVNGCTKTLFATIGNAVLSTATATATATACNTTNGTITLTGVGVNTPYHASINGVGGPWITFPNTTTFTGLAPGTYTITIADDESFDIGPPTVPGGCLTTINVIVPSTGGPSITTTQVNATCASANGSITVNATGGTLPYNYSINGGAYFASNVFNNLSNGLYSLSVKDATGCINGTTTTITSTTGPAPAAVIQSTSCNTNNGTITATGTGGLAPFQYSINGTTFQNSNNFTNLAAGNYTLYIADANGCYGTLPVTIINTALPKVTAFTIPAACNNNDGSIVAAGSLGEAPYTFSINGTVYQSSTNFSGLTAGFYTVYIKDDRGCITTTGVSVGNITAPVITATSTSASCGNANGSISIVATGGTIPYQYSKDGIIYQPAILFSNLSPGTYTISVKDANGCLSTKAVTVANITGTQTLIAAVTNASCGLNNGTITASATGGTAPLQYSTDGTNYQPTTGFANIPAGGYTLYVKDSRGCIATLPVSVLNLAGPALNASSSPASCGINDGTITATATGGTGVLTYSKDGISFQASNIFLNLAAGPYTITVKDARGCTSSFIINVSTFAPGVTPTFTPVNSICSGAVLAPLSTTSLNGITGAWSPALNNTATTTYTFTPSGTQCAASVTVTIAVNPLPAVPTVTITQPTCNVPTGTIAITNSTTGLTFSVDGAPYAIYPAGGYTGVATGPHTLSAQNSTGCNSANSSLTINTAPGAPTAINTTVANASCGTPNGSIILGAVIGGNAPYTYSIDASTLTTNLSYSNLAAGLHSIVVQDASGCTFTSTVTINSSSGATVTATSINASCGSLNGTITAIGTGGVSPYLYSLDGITFQPAAIFTGLAPGAYTIIIKDANNCANSSSATIAGTNGATVTAIATVASCSAANGSITATGTGGVQPYLYSIDGITFQPLNIFAGLTAGVYTITIKDANNCTNSAPVSVTGISGATVTANVTGASCGNNNGTITATGISGATPYQYSLDGITYQSANIFTALPARSYTVTIKDANNCINSASATITNTNGATATATSTAASCGSSNGSVTATATGGALPYQYSINGTIFQAGNIFTGLAAGAYTIIIKDANNCTNSTAVSIAGTSGATVFATSTPASCGTSNGSVTTSASGGAAPYQYSINGVAFQASGSFTGLAAGSYTLSVKDINGCINTTPVIISSTGNARISAIAADAICGNSNGSITVTATGGTMPYQYSLNGTTFQVTNIFTGLAAGAYTVVIKDLNGCTNSQQVVINSINRLVVNAGNDVSICPGSSIQLSASTNATNYSWSPATALTNTSILNPVASPLTTTTYIFTASTGQCINSDTVIVNVFPPSFPYAGTDTTICFGASVPLNGSGGVIYQWSPSANISNPAVANPVFIPSQPGAYSYFLQVTDARGCVSLQKDTVVITVESPLTIFAGNDTSIAINQAIQLNAIDINNNGFTSYLWFPSVGLSNPFIRNPTVILQNPNIYTFTVTATTPKGCKAADDIIIQVFKKAELYVPNVFTPNGDGRNDVLKVIPFGIRELKYFSIYNRWGELVFTTSKLTEGWNGMYKGQKQDSNTFVWVAEAVDFNGNVLVRKGIALLVR